MGDKSTLGISSRFRMSSILTGKGTLEGWSAWGRGVSRHCRSLLPAPWAFILMLGRDIGGVPLIGRFRGGGLLSEDYPVGSGADSVLAIEGRKSCKVLLEHGSYAEDNSSRIQGNAVPNRVRDFINREKLHRGKILLEK